LSSVNQECSLYASNPSHHHTVQAVIQADVLWPWSSLGLLLGQN
jgi:hypothetical protein